MDVNIIQAASLCVVNDTSDPENILNSVLGLYDWAKVLESSVVTQHHISLKLHNPHVAGNVYISRKYQKLVTVDSNVSVVLAQQAHFDPATNLLTLPLRIIAIKLTGDVWARCYQHHELFGGGQRMTATG